MPLLSAKYLAVTTLTRAVPAEGNPLLFKCYSNKCWNWSRLFGGREWSSYFNILGGGLEKSHHFSH